MLSHSSNLKARIATSVSPIPNKIKDKNAVSEKSFRFVAYRKRLWRALDGTSLKSIIASPSLVLDRKDILDIANSTIYVKFWTPKLVSALSFDEIMRAILANDIEANQQNGRAKSIVIDGLNPKAIPTVPIRNNWIVSKMNTYNIFEITIPDLPIGVVPNRTKTLYRLSNPVVIPKLNKAEAIEDCTNINGKYLWRPPSVNDSAIKAMIGMAAVINKLSLRLNETFKSEIVKLTDLLNKVSITFPHYL